MKKEVTFAMFLAQLFGGSPEDYEEYEEIK